MRIAFINSLSEAKIALENPNCADSFVCFCPAAKYALDKAGLNCTSNADTYRSLSHAKNAYLTSKDSDLICDLAQQIYQLSEGEKFGLKAYVINFLSVIYYNYFSIRQFIGAANSYVIIKNNAPFQENNATEVLQHLVSDTVDKFNSYEITNYSLLNYYVAKACNFATAKIQRINKKFRISNNGISALKQVIAEIGTHQKLAILSTRKMGKSTFQTLILFVRNIVKILSGNKKGKPVFYFRAIDPKEYQKRDLNKDAEFYNRISSLKFPSLHIAALAQIYTADYIPFLKANSEAGRDLIRRFDVRLFLTDHVIHNFLRAGTEEVSKLGGVNIVINQGSHTYQEDEISKIAALLWAKTGRVVSENATYYTPKLPLTEKLAYELVKNIPEAIKVHPYKKVSTHKRNNGDDFYVLYAGNYSGPDFHMPWCTETPTEFLYAIFELIEEISKMDNVKLIIKLKIQKAHIHLDSIKQKIQSLGVEDKVIIDINSSFISVLEKADLVISNLSAALEEAIYNKKPLMLYSFRKKYFHLPCSFKPANKNNLSYVYGIKNKNDICQIISSVKTYYLDIMSSSDSLKGITWQEQDFSDIHAVSQEIIARCNYAK